MSTLNLNEWTKIFSFNRVLGKLRSLRQHFFPQLTFSVIHKFRFRNIHSHLWFYSCSWREVLTSSAPGHMEQMKALVIKCPEVAEVRKPLLFRELQLQCTLAFKVIGKVDRGCENHIAARNITSHSQWIDRRLSIHFKRRMSLVGIFLQSCTLAFNNLYFLSCKIFVYKTI